MLLLVAYPTTFQYLMYLGHLVFYDRPGQSMLVLVVNFLYHFWYFMTYWGCMEVPLMITKWNLSLFVLVLVFQYHLNPH